MRRQIRANTHTHTTTTAPRVNKGLRARDFLNLFFYARAALLRDNFARYSVYLNSYFGIYTRPVKFNGFVTELEKFRVFGD